MAFGIGEALTLVSLLATLASGAAKAGGAINESQEEEAKTRREEEIEKHAENLKKLRERRQRRDQIAKSLNPDTKIIDVGEPSQPKPYKTDINPAWGIMGGISDMAASTSAYGANQVGKTPDTKTPSTGNKYSNAYSQPAAFQTDVMGTGSTYDMANRYDPNRIYGGPLYG